jgi:hypothetical protein
MGGIEGAGEAPRSRWRKSEDGQRHQDESGQRERRQVTGGQDLQADLKIGRGTVEHLDAVDARGLFDEGDKAERRHGHGAFTAAGGQVQQVVGPAGDADGREGAAARARAGFDQDAVALVIADEASAGS